MIVDETKIKNSTVDEISDESFARMEKFCEKTMRSESELLDDIEIPKLNDTLEEVDFILSLGAQLKAEGKINFPTLPFSHSESEVPVVNVKNASLVINNCTLVSSTPKSSRSNLMPKLICRNRLSSILYSPTAAYSIRLRCNSDILSSVMILSFLSNFQLTHISCLTISGQTNQPKNQVKFKIIKNFTMYPFHLSKLNCCSFFVSKKNKIFAMFETILIKSSFNSNFY